MPQQAPAALPLAQPVPYPDKSNLDIPYPGDKMVAVTQTDEFIATVDLTGQHNEKNGAISVIVVLFYTHPQKPIGGIQAGALAARVSFLCGKASTKTKHLYVLTTDNKIVDAGDGDDTYIPVTEGSVFDAIGGYVCTHFPLTI